MSILDQVNTRFYGALIEAEDYQGVHYQLVCSDDGNFITDKDYFIEAFLEGAKHTDTSNIRDIRLVSFRLEDEGPIVIEGDSKGEADHGTS